MSRGSAIAKVRKLLALANDRAATEPEKASARSKAEMLMEKYGLEEYDVQPPRRVPPRPPTPQPSPFFPSGQIVIIFGNQPTTSASGLNATFYFR